MGMMCRVEAPFKDKGMDTLTRHRPSSSGERLSRSFHQGEQHWVEEGLLWEAGVEAEGCVVLSLRSRWRMGPSACPGSACLWAAGPLPRPPAPRPVHHVCGAVCLWARPILTGGPASQASRHTGRIR